MLLSSRAQPPKALTDFPYPSRSNLSVKQFLLNSPLPSPALPALVPRHGKKPPPFNSRRAIRYLVWLTIIITIYYVASFLSLCLRDTTSRQLPALPYLTSSGKTYEIVAETELPEYPTPLGVLDNHNRKKWTISIPDRLSFPLPAADYADICSHIDEVAGHISAKSPDTTFLDVSDAQRQNLLPPPHRSADANSALPVCDKSVTYVLDATEAGLGSTLMALWISYAQAQREGRAFFIDDSHFAYGRYATFFEPPPTPKCRAPPPSQRIPCVAKAKHQVISAATHPWTFGAAFRAQHSTDDIYALARQGYEALFQLRTADDAAYINNRLEELRSLPASESLTTTNSEPASPQALVAIHLRRGDRHPLTLAYSRAYLPAAHYLSAAEKLSAQLMPSGGGVTTVLATDDPEMHAHAHASPHDAPEAAAAAASSPSLLTPNDKTSPLTDATRLTHLPPAQLHVRLTSKSHLPPGTLGWEGGFFPALFWSLGQPAAADWQKRIGSPTPSRLVAELSEAERDARDWRANPTDEARGMRELIARAWLLDLSVLGRADGVVCASGTYTCRLAAVMLGPEKVRMGRWVDVEEGGWGWWGMDA